MTDPQVDDPFPESPMMVDSLVDVLGPIGAVTAVLREIRRRPGKSTRVLANGLRRAISTALERAGRENELDSDEVKAKRIEVIGFIEVKSGELDEDPSRAIAIAEPRGKIHDV